MPSALGPEPEQTPDHDAILDGFFDVQAAITECFKKPTKKFVCEVVAAAGGAPPCEVATIIRRHAGAYPPGHKNRPHTFAWFKATVRNACDEARRAAPSPMAAVSAKLNTKTFDEMTRAIELPDAPPNGRGAAR